MTSLIETLFAKAWNKIAAPSPRGSSASALDLGAGIVDEQITTSRVAIPQSKRAEHIAILGKTGQGKSFFLRHLASQDIRADRGFVFFDLHGDTMPFLLRVIAQEEAQRRADLSSRLVVIEPGDPEYSIGLNVLERHASEQTFVQLAEFAQILKQRWHLDHLGARTEELLRNALHVLSDNDLTLLELAPLLTNGAFRALCLQRVTNSEVEGYFRSRFDRASEAMQTVYRDAILNKISGFTADPRFRRVLSVSLRNSVCYWRSGPFSGIEYPLR
jgi:succinyl-CoA synthetase beta subunit